MKQQLFIDHQLHATIPIYILINESLDTKYVIHIFCLFLLFIKFAFSEETFLWIFSQIYCYINRPKDTMYSQPINKLRVSLIYLLKTKFHYLKIILLLQWKDFQACLFNMCICVYLHFIDVLLYWHKKRQKELKDTIKCNLWNIIFSIAKL